VIFLPALIDFAPSTDPLIIKSILNCNLLAISSAGKPASASGTVEILLATGGMHLGVPPIGGVIGRRGILWSCSCGRIRFYANQVFDQ
jgi:hypothetical protein